MADDQPQTTGPRWLRRRYARDYRLEARLSLGLPRRLRAEMDRRGRAFQALTFQRSATERDLALFRARGDFAARRLLRRLDRAEGMA